MRTFQEYLDKKRQEINRHIKLITKDKISDPDVTPALLNGKRIRAGLLFLVFDAVPGRDKDISRALDLACAIELAHSASLILDDILDGDKERRGRPAAHLTRGHKRAILDAIDILSLPYDIASQYGELYVHMLAETQRGMVSGVVKELFHASGLQAAELYDVVITQKTGRLFSLAATWGYLAARSDDPAFSEMYRYRKEMASFAEYGLGCGKAMQIADDIVDMRKVIEGKKAGMPGSELLLLGQTDGDINSILDKEITGSRMTISSVDVAYAYREMLLNVPSGIVDIMLNEG
ncbi:MAG: polyprenyl synthetase [Candidatus Methanoperedens sp.]|nr:polyprenyl synthetase [Candidatus Methanoperedens sp.]